MRKIIEYFVAWGEGCESLTREVNNLIKDGWEIHGLMIISEKRGLYQVMVKYQEEMEEPIKT
jgi:hypothetical protein